MVVGMDVYHDSAKKGRSVVGFVASLNRSVTRYFSKVVFQEAHQELIDQLARCMNGWWILYVRDKNMRSGKIWCVFCLGWMYPRGCTASLYGTDLV